jgi:hypothetical protein
MIQLLVVVAVLFVLAVMFALLISALVILAMIAAIGIPLWLIAKYWLGQRGVSTVRPHPIDRLRNLYVEGKIDLFEFERRVAKLVAIEH